MTQVLRINMVFLRINMVVIYLRAWLEIGNGEVSFPFTDFLLAARAGSWILRLFVLKIRSLWVSLSLSDTHMVYRTPSTMKIKKRDEIFLFLLSRGSVFYSGWGHLGPFIHTQHELNRACSKCNLVLSNTRNLAAI